MSPEVSVLRWYALVILSAPAGKLVFLAFDVYLEAAPFKERDAVKAF
jgi:hypothetical protein